MYSETQYSRHSTGKLICKYILFRNSTNSEWAPCDCNGKSDGLVMDEFGGDERIQRGRRMDKLEIRRKGCGEFNKG